MIAVLGIPPLALVTRWVQGEGIFGRSADSAAERSASVIEALIVTLSTTSASTLLILLLGTPLAYVLATRTFPGKRIVSVLVELPLVMPPIVAGLALLLAFGRNGIIGAHLAARGVTIAMTPVAVVLAQLFVAAPFLIRAAQLRFAAIPQSIRDAAAIDGCSPRTTFWRITLPLSRRALGGGVVLSWARAVGEFGATILFAGNLAGRTRTMTSLVYTELERDIGASVTVAVVLLALAGIALAAVHTLTHIDDVGDELGVD